MEKNEKYEILCDAIQTTMEAISEHLIALGNRGLSWTAISAVHVASETLGAIADQLSAMAGAQKTE